MHKTDVHLANYLKVLLAGKRVASFGDGVGKTGWLSRALVFFVQRYQPKYNEITLFNN